MLGIIWHRSKVLNVLKTMFQYDPNLSGPQRATFNAVTKQMRKIGGNEYDSAVAFMLVQLDAGPGLEGGDDDWKRFRRKLLTDAAYCSDHAILNETKEAANGLFDEMVNNEDTDAY